MSQELTQDGGRSGGEEVNTSSISETRRLLMSTKTRILKDKRSLSGESTMAGTRDGELFILIQSNTRRKELQDGMENMDSISIELCTSDQDFQCRELSNSYHGMLESEDTIQEEEINRPGDSTEYPRPFKT
jgi:hypothetical protein